MLNVLIELGGSLNPEMIKTDFELGSINAFRNIFPNVRISGCLFHLGQSIQRKVAKMGLKSLYKTDRRVKKFVRFLSSLSFVREDKVIETFNDLKNCEDFPIKLTELYDYFG